jgi:hypothetical protein
LDWGGARSSLCLDDDDDNVDDDNDNDDNREDGLATLKHIKFLFANLL